MKKFESTNVIPIGAGVPNRVQSGLNVSGGPQNIQNITVNIDIDHTYTSDLVIALFAPSGRGVLLVNERGGRGNNFKNTTFDDAAQSPISNMSPPFTGTFRPEGLLSSFIGENANGSWTLRIDDTAFIDGGKLNSWSISVDDEGFQSSDYTINVNFNGGLSASQMDVFADAARRWSEVIISDLTLEIGAKGENIDGVGRILGRAGPTSVTPGTLFPDKGVMEFDSSDLASMETNGSLFNVILHEMGHVIGIGTLWTAHNLLNGGGTNNPVFIGSNAMREYGELLGTRAATEVPAANTGGQGTADSHWRESTFGNELMSGYADQGLLPLSRLTVAMLEDMGYAVNSDAADPYVLPSQRMLNAMMAASAAKRKYNVIRPICEGI